MFYKRETVRDHQKMTSKCLKYMETSFGQPFMNLKVKPLNFNIRTLLTILIPRL